MNLLIYISIFIYFLNTCFAYDDEDLKHFLSEGKCNKCDLSNADFSGQYLDKLVITNSNLSGSNFDNAKFAAVKLNQVIFQMLVLIIQICQALLLKIQFLVMLYLIMLI